MKRILILVLEFTSMTALWAADNSIITYTAPAKLPEVTTTGGGICITQLGYGSTYFESHTFSNGVGTLQFSGDVLGLKRGVFKGCSTMTSITIPETATQFNPSVFEGCKQLESVTLSSKAKEIPASMFFGCESLQHITLPSQLTTIGENAFYDCKQLRSITIPNKVTTIELGAFDGCVSLTSFHLPASVSALKYGVFMRCTALDTITVDAANLYYWSPESHNAIISNGNVLMAVNKSMTIPEGVEYLGEYLFSKSKMTAIHIPEGVKQIMANAFYNCENLSAVDFPSSLETILMQAFAGCTSLTKVVLPNGLLYLNAYVFWRSLQQIVLPSSLIKMGNGLFDMYSELNSITCYATTPPTCTSSTFYTVEKSIPVYVPQGAVSAYQSADGWKDFTNIKGLSASVQPMSGTQVITDPKVNEVTITWPVSASASTYEVIVQQDETPVVTYTFDAQGHLINTNKERKMQMAQAAVLATDGYQFTITGLNSGTAYTYSIEAKNAGGASVATYNGSFTTEVFTDIIRVEDAAPVVRKVMHNGQLMIEYQGTMYNAVGGKVE